MLRSTFVRSLPILLPVAMLIPTFAGCSSASREVGLNGADAGDTGATPDGEDPDAGTCTILAAHYDATCTSDSDCVAVPVGGDTCNPCSAGTGDFVCPLAALNVKDESTYQSALTAGLQKLGVGTSQYQQCVIASCPVFKTAVCSGGTCSVGNVPETCGNLNDAGVQQAGTCATGVCCGSAFDAGHPVFSCGTGGGGCPP